MSVQNGPRIVVRIGGKATEAGLAFIGGVPSLAYRGRLGAALPDDFEVDGKRYTAVSVRRSDVTDGFVFVQLRQLPAD